MVVPRHTNADEQRRVAGNAIQPHQHVDRIFDRWRRKLKHFALTIRSREIWETSEVTAGNTDYPTVLGDTRRLQPKVTLQPDELRPGMMRREDDRNTAGT